MYLVIGITFCTCSINRWLSSKFSLSWSNSVGKSLKRCGKTLQNYSGKWKAFISVYIQLVYCQKWHFDMMNSNMKVLKCMDFGIGNLLSYRSVINQSMLNFRCFLSVPAGLTDNCRILFTKWFLSWRSVSTVWIQSDVFYMIHVHYVSFYF